MADQLGSEQKQLEANLALLELDGVDVDVLRNMIVGTPSREGELGVAEDSQTGDFDGMSFTSNGTEIAVAGGKADVSGISGEISLQGYQYGSAIPDSGLLLEGFEDGSLSGSYGGDTGSATVQNGTVYAGNYALQMGGGKYDTISRTDINIERGNVYSGWIRNDSSGAFQIEAGIVFMSQEATATPGGYFIEIQQDDGAVTVYKTQAGESLTGDSIASASLSTSTDTWYEAEFKPNDDGTEDYTIYDASGNELVSFSSSDGEFDVGGIGFAHGGDGGDHVGFFDDIRRWS